MFSLESCIESPIDFAFLIGNSSNEDPVPETLISKSKKLSLNIFNYKSAMRNIILINM